MFFTKFRRHDRNSKFEAMLKTIRMNKVTNEIMTILLKKYHEFDIQSLTNRSIVLMFLKINVKKLNQLMLKRYCNDVSYEHNAMNKKQITVLTKNTHLRQFKKKSIFFKR